MRAWWSKLRVFLRGRGHFGDELHEEIKAHFELEVEDGLDKGLTRDQAVAAARPRFGNPTLIAEQTWETWNWRWLDQLRQDLAYGCRSLWRAKGFTLAAIGVLALGIGANLAEFHIFDVIVFNRLTIRDAHSLFRLSRQSKGRGQNRFPVAATIFYRDHATLLNYVVTENSGLELNSDDDTSPLRSNFVSADYFADLGIRPSYGRLLVSSDAQPGAPPVVAIGYLYWQTHFGSDSTVVNRTMRLNGKPVQIVGILPPEFDGLSPRRTAVWLPYSTLPYLVAGLPPLDDFRQIDTEMFTKLKPGVSMEAAEAQLRSLTNELGARQPQYVRPDEWIRGDALQFMPPIREIPPIAIMIIVLVLLVLLSACANLGNVLLARGLAREREIDIRIAVGAGRWRVVRQLMTESFLLAALGSAAGLAVGYLAAKGLVYVVNAPPDIHIVIDWRIVAAGGALAIVSVLAFGLAPALQAVRHRGHTATRARQVLVGAQVAIGCVLLILAALMIHGVQRGATIDVPFDYAHMVVVDARNSSRDSTPIAARQRVVEMTDRLEQLPGVRAVTAAILPPLGGGRGYATLPGLPLIYLNGVAPSYFQFMNLPILRGRTFLPGEQSALVVSESAARAAWPNEDPLGKTWDLGRWGQGSVVGVVKDSGANMFADPTSIEAYLPLTDPTAGAAMIILHASGDPLAILNEARSALSQPGLAVSAQLMQAQVNDRIRALHDDLTVIASLGGIATFLAALGIFGLVAFAVAQRTREIGVRMTLGARPTDIVRTLLAHYLVSISLGTAAGVALSVAGGQILRNQFYGFVSLDAASFVAGLTVFGVVLLLAMLFPARRALRIDVASALRWE